ncbi:MAG TPA: ABC transporter ATP-binding protein/permease [Candidatus Borkfalkia excrementigallinarum]|uniref:ABC transporter ATP-binding protein/permease n=1 Tax=Candidatus Borkfalkia excrementigallinarum TaxID=2838506 RepID=A0A9D1ZX24_9FIRM|nr:ABC transporter ATP-binding protein/permease [Candidatus Borkfalkia excrementigallinarum]
MKLILRFLKPHWKLFLLTVFLLIVDVVGALIIPTLASEMLRQGETGVEMQVLINTAIAMAVAAVISGAGGIMSGYVCAELVSRIAKDIRDALYKKTLDLAVSDFRTFGVASMTTRTVSDVTNIQFALMASIQMVLPVPVVFVISLILAFMKDWMMGLILLAVLAVITVVALLIMRSASPLFRKLQKLLDKMSTVLLENITGVRVVRAFNKEEHEHQRLDAAFSDYAVTSIKANRMFASLDGLSFFAVNIFVIIVYALSGFRVTAGAFLVTDITAIVEYAILALLYLMMAQMVILTLPRAFECSGRVKAVLDFSPTIRDLTDKQVWFPASSENVVDFRNAAFRFPDSEEYTLKNLNFTCKRGETTAIIGGTGSGKSTVASLILRFNDVTDGELLLNNVNIRKMPQNQLRGHIAYVQQRAWLFAGTIAENLRYSNPNATDEELWHALKVAQAEDFVRSLPDGLNSFVAQGGTNFSGGQKQRLSIARALVKKPELYIFDDSFSALDFKTDAALRRALAYETQNAAVLIIAQRVSTIRHAERIVVLGEGEPVGIGTHDELLMNCPVYKEIYESQTKEADEQHG